MCLIRNRFSTEREFLLNNGIAPNNEAILLYIAALLYIVLFPAMGSAATTITIKPMLTISGQYDSNFYRTDDNEREVYTYLIQPGIQLGIETAKSKVTFNYRLNAYFYDDISAVPVDGHPASHEDYVGSYALLDAKYLLTDRLTIGVEDSFYKSREVYTYDEYTDNTERRKHYINRLTPYIFYNFGERFSAGLRYRRQDIDYNDSSMDDSVEHRGIFDLLYRPSRTTTIDFQYQHWKMDEEQDDLDYTSDQLQLIFTKRFRYFSVKLGVGYHHRDYDESDADDDDALIYIGYIDAAFPLPFKKINVTFGYRQNFSDLGEFRINNSYALNIRRLFLEKIEVSLDGYYTVSEYIGKDFENREDEIYGVSGTVRYPFRDWLTFSVSAGMTDRDSNMSGYDYENFFVSWGLEMSYPITFGKRDIENDYQIDYSND